MLHSPPAEVCHSIGIERLHVSQTLHMIPPTEAEFCATFPKGEADPSELHMYRMLTQVELAGFVLTKFVWYSDNLQAAENDFVIVTPSGTMVIDAKGGVYTGPRYLPTLKKRVAKGLQQGSAVITCIRKMMREHIAKRDSQDQLRWPRQSNGDVIVNMMAAAALPKVARLHLEGSDAALMSDVNTLWEHNCNTPASVRAYLLSAQQLMTTASSEQSRAAPPMGDDQWSIVRSFYATDLATYSMDKVVADEATNIRVSWDASQARVVSALGLRKMALSGFAGSGKTLLLLRHIDFLIRERTGSIVIIVKMQALQQALLNIHPWLQQPGRVKMYCRNELINDHGVRLTAASDLLQHPPEHIVIDECQRFCFPEYEWLLLKQIEQESDASYPDTSTCWLAFDDNQKYLLDGVSPVQLEQDTYARGYQVSRLYAVHRNGNDIIQLARNMHFHNDYILLGNTFQGSVHWTTTTGTTVDAGLSQLKNVLPALLSGPSVEHQRLALITMNYTIRDRIESWLDQHMPALTTCRAESAHTSSMVVDSVHNFQGLDRDCVIFFMPTWTSKTKHAVYIGITRAVSALYIICAPWVKAQIEGASIISPRRKSHMADVTTHEASGATKIQKT